MILSARMSHTYMTAMVRAALVCPATEFQTLMFMDTPTTDMLLTMLIITHITARTICRLSHLRLCRRSAKTVDSQVSPSRIYDTHQRTSLMECPMGMAQRIHLPVVVPIPICGDKQDTTAVDQDPGIQAWFPHPDRPTNTMSRLDTLSPI